MSLSHFFFFFPLFSFLLFSFVIGVIELELLNALAPHRRYEADELFAMVDAKGEKKYIRLILFSDILIRVPPQI